jgi:hypothetical protein
MRTLMALVLIGLASSSYAMRCGGEIVGVGSRVDQIQACNPSSAYQDRNFTADQGYIVVKRDGMTTVFTTIDGVITGEEGSR